MQFEADASEVLAAQTQFRVSMAEAVIQVTENDEVVGPIQNLIAITGMESTTEHSA